MSERAAIESISSVWRIGGTVGSRVKVSPIAAAYRYLVVGIKSASMRTVE